MGNAVVVPRKPRNRGVTGRRRAAAAPVDTYIAPEFCIDLDAPYATTADRRNPWPQIWHEQLEAGHTDLHRDCVAAAHEWRLRQGVSGGEIF